MIHIVLWTRLHLHTRASDCARRPNNFSQYTLFINRCQIAKEMSGTLSFVSSLRFSFVKRVKAAHIKDALFYSIGSCTPCFDRGFNDNNLFSFYYLDDGSEVDARQNSYCLLVLGI